MSRLLDAAGEAPFVFVTGKGGVGKSTAAGVLSLELADAGTATHLISVDPAHSLADLFQHAIGGDVITSACSPMLQVEEFDAARAGDAWIERALGPVTGLVEGGTYLDGEDVAAFSRLALPGIDEMMAVLRLADLADNAGKDLRIVVDTAPTGHTLRLLDAADTHEAIARALRAMADKAAAVAGAMTGRAVRLRGEDIIDQLERTVTTYRELVLAPAAFIVAARAGSVVEAETGRLASALHRRGLRVAALLTVGPEGRGALLPGTPQLRVPLLEDVSGCSGLRTWREHVTSGRSATPGPGPDVQVASGRSATPRPGPDVHVTSGRDETSGPGPEGPASPSAAGWLEAVAGRLLLFAGKGGVGKSTCAAAAALALAGSRDVLLCSTDPAGSLSDVLASSAARPYERVRVLQIEPAAQLERLRDSYQEEVVAALEGLGLSESAALDRRVIEALWDLSPPGLDELAATATMVAASRSEETVVIDSSPTGHFLRLLEMPEVALGWTRQLMRVFVKYGIAGVAGGAAESLLELSRELRALRDRLHDPASASVIIVTLDEPMVRAETERLAAALGRADVRIAAVLVNRAAGAAEAQHATVGAVSDAAAMIRAPALDPPPIGERALRGFVGRWNIVA
jgi:arsenite-transporting ATPase